MTRRAESTGKGSSIFRAKEPFGSSRWTRESLGTGCRYGLLPSTDICRLPMRATRKSDARTPGRPINTTSASASRTMSTGGVSTWFGEPYSVTRASPYRDLKAVPCQRRGRWSYLTPVWGEPDARSLDSRHLRTFHHHKHAGERCREFRGNDRWHQHPYRLWQ